ncbi:MAG: hypothetical protein M0Q88_08465 [Bacilli bacterium]|nr:hypothetical protein [Bacilli bacterium]
MSNNELLEQIKDVAEVVILNVREDNEKEIKTLHSKIDKLIEILVKIVD